MHIVDRILSRENGQPHTVASAFTRLCAPPDLLELAIFVATALKRCKVPLIQPSWVLVRPDGDLEHINIAGVAVTFDWRYLDRDPEATQDATDQFVLGTLLYQSLSGALPYPVGRDREWTPVRLGCLVPVVEELENVVHTMIAGSARDRFPCLEGACESLRELSTGELERRVPSRTRAA